MIGPTIDDAPASVREAFDRNIARGRPDVAVRLALGAGFRVPSAGVPTPFLDGLESAPRELRGTYAETHAARIALERSARTILANQDRMLDDRASAAAAARDTERADWIEARAAELEAEDLAERRRRWQEAAEREALERFASPADEPSHTTPTPATPPPTESLAPARTIAPRILTIQQEV